MQTASAQIQGGRSRSRRSRSQTVFSRLMTKPGNVARIFVLLCLAVVLSANPSYGRSSPRVVAAQFYKAWFAAVQSAHSNFDRTLASQKSLFEPSFYALIDAVNELERKNTQQIEGYDCDPFFMTQDTVYAYHLGKETRVHGEARIPVYVIDQRAGGPKRYVLTVQLRTIGARWRIVDMVYPPGKNSVGTLKKWSQQILTEYKNRK